MLKNTVVIAALLILSIVTYYLYQTWKIPEGVIPKGDNTETLAWLALGTSIVSLLAAIVGLIEKILDLKKSKSSS